MDINLNNLFSDTNSADLSNAIVVIGRATSGPARIPVIVNNLNVGAVFGNETELTLACLQCLNYGQTVVAIRLNGKHSSVSLKDSSDNNLLTFTSAHANSNDIRVDVEQTEDLKTKISIYDITSAKEFVVTVVDTAPLSFIASKINNAAASYSVGVIAESLTDGTASQLAAITGAQLTGGDSEVLLTSDEKAAYLNSIYKSFSYLDFSTVCNMTIEMFETYDSGRKYFYDQLSSFLASRNDGYSPTIAVIPVDDYKTSDDVPYTDQEGYLESITAMHTEMSNVITLSRYIVAATGLYSAYDTITYRAAPAVASIINTTDPQDSPLVNSIGAFKILNPLDSSIVQGMRNLGIICLCNTIRRNVLMSCDTTTQIGYPVKKNKVAFYVVRGLRELFDSHIGEPMPAVGNALDLKIDGLLANCVTSKILSKYRYTVSIDRKENQMTIDVEMVPYGTVDTISISITEGI